MRVKIILLLIIAMRCMPGQEKQIEIVREDLNRYELSQAVKDTIISNLREASEKYKIPILLLHAIIRTESEYKFWVTHKDIVVKGKKTQAIGLGGIVWEYWADSLKNKGIAEAKSDLYLIQKNIKATAYVLRVAINKRGAKGIKDIIKLYTGAYNERYYSKLKKVLDEVLIEEIEQEIKES